MVDIVPLHRSDSQVRGTKEENGDYYRSEVSQGSFSRTVTLPASVDQAGAKAQLKDGMLEVTLPKDREAQEARDQH
jgi:HSP20 family protein